MAPTIDIFRHAIANHNIHGSHIPDPSLTECGLEQCVSLYTYYPFAGKVSRIISSPLRRTIETAILGVKPMVRDDIKIELMPELQEVNASPSSTGSPVEDLSRCYGKVVDLTTLGDFWYRKGPETPFAPDPEKVEARALVARRKIRDVARSAVASGNPDTHIAVVTHGEFAHWLTDDFVGVSERHNSGWANLEFRSYKFITLDESDRQARLVEKVGSRARRGVMINAPVYAPHMELLRGIAWSRVMLYAEEAREDAEDEEEEDDVVL
ncbi:histidine phosphatase superfamily [Hypoxylon sp. NC1633]|nr:histidine phosphatase superfamily [Hypoxylon sp. NC1633]